MSAAALPLTGLLRGRVALVTGASQGLGADIAAELAAAGAEAVVLVGLGAEAGAAVAAAIGPVASFVEADITDDAALAALLAQIQARHGRLEVLVHAACRYDDAGLASTRAQWRQSLDVNLVSAAVLTQLALPLMPPGAVVIHLGSVGGKFGAEGRALYPAAKAALLQLTRNLAVSLAPQGIRVLSVSPAWTWSPALQRLAGGDVARADAVAAPLHPLGRAGRGAEVGRVVAFLASAQAGWVTGTDVAVDGGFACLGPDQGHGAGWWFARAGAADGAAAGLAGGSAGGFAGD